MIVSLNALTPANIAVTRLVPAPAGFDARKNASSRSYRYHLSTGVAMSPFWKQYSWWIPLRLDVGAMADAAALTVGRHDFTAFTPTETEHVFFRRMVLKCAWRRGRDGILTFEIEAEAFLRGMVRALVGTMVEVGQGRRSVSEYGRLLEGRSRLEAGPTAPACGLFLWDVKY
jgi:tRNA pseudouridine38-40 synthase